MPNGKNGKNGNGHKDASQIDADELEDNLQQKLIKDIIRSCVMAGVNSAATRKYINAVLGPKTDRNGDIILDKDDNPVPKQISKSTFYRIRETALSYAEIEKDMKDFVKIDYALEISSTRSMLKVLINIIFQSILSEAEKNKRAKLAIDLIKAFPNYTQFLDINKSAIQHGKIKLEHEASPLATSN